MAGRYLRTVEAIFGDPLPPLTEAQQTALAETLDAQIETLFRGAFQPVKTSDRNRAIARRLLVDGFLIKAAAAEFGLSSSRIGQIHAKALRLLRHPTRSFPLKAIFRTRECAECHWTGLTPAKTCPVCGGLALFVRTAEEAHAEKEWLARLRSE